MRASAVKYIFAALLLGFNLLAGIPPSTALSAPEYLYPVLNEFPLPKSVSLCGEPMPLENPRVREMLDREFTIAVWDRAQVFMWLKRAGRYFPYIEKKLAEEGMPDDLKYLAVAESALLTHIRSRKGALGTWQFMARTARRNGLRKDRKMDERRNFERSTEAALKYLRSLKDMFGTWTLALAGYNCGEARLGKEIKQQKVRDYYRLNLPMETERFIFRIATAKIIMGNPRRYGYRLLPERVYKPIACDRVPVRINTPRHITGVAKAIGTDFKVIKELNPQIHGYYLPPGRYTLKVPAGKGPGLAAVLKQTPSPPRQSVKVESGQYYVVRPGDSLSRISVRTGVSVTTLKRLNGIRGSLIRVGQKLRLSP